MKLQPFKLERFFARHEFSAPHLLCCSDCEAWTVQAILDLEPAAEEHFRRLGLGYTEAAGSPELRREIAALHEAIRPEEVLVHTGAQEAIFLFMNTVLEPGDHIIVQFPCYQSLYEVPRAAGADVTRWELREGPRGWELDLNFPERAIGPRTRAIVINSPHNPTGFLPSRQEFDAIIALARRHGLYLFSDEVYRHLEYDEGDRLPWAVDRYENAVSLGVMSKSFGLAGLRIGWVATRNRRLLAELAAAKDYTSICAGAPGEFLASVALRNRERILARNREIIAANLVLLDAFFERHRERFAWNRPRAGPIAFPRWLGEGTASGLAERLLREAGVLILPGELYDYDGRYFRVGYGRKGFGEGLERMEQAIAAG